MYYKEFGSVENDTILLLHGGGLSWWNYREEVQLLLHEYHVILPVLDGHAESDHPFTTIEENAAEIISFIDEKLGGSVLLIGGLSLGGQILLEMLSQRKNICQYALVESAAILPSKITTALIGPAFESSYHLIQNKKFAKLQFHSLHIKEDLFEDYYRDTCHITKTDMIAFMKASTSYTLKESFSKNDSQVFVLAGKKENRTVLYSAELICRSHKKSKKILMDNYYHGDFSINHANEYVEFIKRILT